MYEVVRINVGGDPEVIELKSFDFQEIAKELGCDYVEPVECIVEGEHFVVFADENGKLKDGFTYTGFRGGWNPLAGEVRVQAFVNTLIIAKVKYNKYRPLMQEDMDIISERLMCVEDKRRGTGDQVFLNFTSLNNDELAKEM